MTYTKKGSSPSYVRLECRNEAKTESIVRKGHVPMLVGTNIEVMQRFLIPVKLVNHPFLVSLLDKAVEEFGDSQNGMLRVFCDAEYFKGMMKTI